MSDRATRQRSNPELAELHIRFTEQVRFFGPCSTGAWMGWTEQMAKIVAWTKHTSPEAAAKVYARTNPGLAMSFHATIAPVTPQPILDGIRNGYDGPVVVAQDFTVVNITPEQIVTRMVDVDPLAYIVSDQEYITRMGGSNQDPSQNPGTLPQWLEDTIIPVTEIEDFKAQLREKGMR